MVKLYRGIEGESSHIYRERNVRLTGPRRAKKVLRMERGESGISFVRMMKEKVVSEAGDKGG